MQSGNALLELLQENKFFDFPAQLAEHLTLEKNLPEIFAIELLNTLAQAVKRTMDKAALKQLGEIVGSLQSCLLSEPSVSKLFSQVSDWVQVKREAADKPVSRKLSQEITSAVVQSAKVSILADDEYSSPNCIQAGPAVDLLAKKSAEIDRLLANLEKLSALAEQAQFAQWAKQKDFETYGVGSQSSIQTATLQQRRQPAESDPVHMQQKMSTATRASRQITLPPAAPVGRAKRAVDLEEMVYKVKYQAIACLDWLERYAGATNYGLKHLLRRDLLCAMASTADPFNQFAVLFAHHIESAEPIKAQKDERWQSRQAFAERLLLSIDHPSKRPSRRTEAQKLAALIVVANSAANANTDKHYFPKENIEAFNLKLQELQAQVSPPSLVEVMECGDKEERKKEERKKKQESCCVLM